MAFFSDHKAYLVIKNRLLTDEFSPSLPLSINFLSNELRLSQVPIREALIRLAQEDLVDLVPFKGFFPHQPSMQELVGCYNLIKYLMCTYAVKMISQHPSHMQNKRRKYAKERKNLAIDNDDIDSFNQMTVVNPVIFEIAERFDCDFGRRIFLEAVFKTSTYRKFRDFAKNRKLGNSGILESYCSHIKAGKWSLAGDAVSVYLDDVIKEIPENIGHFLGRHQMIDGYASSGRLEETRQAIRSGHAKASLSVQADRRQITTIDE